MNLINHCLGTLEKAKIHNLLIALICLVIYLHCSKRNLESHGSAIQSPGGQSVFGARADEVLSLSGLFPYNPLRAQLIECFGSFKSRSWVTTCLILEKRKVKLAPNARGLQPSLELLKV